MSEPAKLAFCTIYLLTNKTNGKVYVGQTWQTLSERAGTNGRGYVECTHLNNAIRKYGWDNFSSRKLTIVLSQVDANAAEDFFINLYNSRNPLFGYNVRGGGSTGQLSEETKKKLSELNSGEGNHFFGKTHTDGAKTIIGANTRENHRAGKYALRNEELRKFTKEEEAEIVDAYQAGSITIQQLISDYGFSYSTFDRMRERNGLETIPQPKTEKHRQKLVEHLQSEEFQLARQPFLQQQKESAVKLQEQVIELRNKGMLQKEIAIELDITQVRASQLLIDAGMRTETKRTTKKK